MACAGCGKDLGGMRLYRSRGMFFLLCCTCDVTVKKDERDVIRAREVELQAARAAIADAWTRTTHRRTGPWPDWYARHSDAVDAAIAAFTNTASGGED